MKLIVYKTELNDFDSDKYPREFNNVYFLMANKKLFSFGFKDDYGVYVFNYDFPYYFFEVLNE